jgi:hypothetical protein
MEYEEWEKTVPEVYTEGYSRSTGRDRARFYEYSLGSSRESRDWYFKGRHILGETIVQHRLQLLSEIIRLILTMVPQQRRHLLREENILYQTDSDNVQLDNLLQNVPIPDL